MAYSQLQKRESERTPEMTTTVKRGAGRPAATERRNRHAQTTALPPRSTEAEATAQAATDPAAETPVEAREQYGRMTVAELRARLDVLTGAAPRKRLTKGELLNAILEAEREGRGMDAPVEDTQKAPESGQDPTTAPSAGKDLPAAKPAPQKPNAAVPGDNPGVRKALKLKEQIAPHGWKQEPDWEISGEAPARVTAIARRGAEVLTVVWDSGVFNYELSGHLIEDRHTKIRNVSHGRQLAARPAAEASAELARVVSNRSFRPAAPRTSTARGKLPFDPETSSDSDVLSAIQGRYVVWVNRISNLEEHALASKESRLWKITGDGATRTIQFTTETGFRAARLDQILRVGKPTRKRAVSAETEAETAEAEAA